MLHYHSFLTASWATCMLIFIAVSPIKCCVCTAGIKEEGFFICLNLYMQFREQSIELYNYVQLNHHQERIGSPTKSVRKVSIHIHKIYSSEESQFLDGLAIYKITLMVASLTGLIV